MAGTAELSVVIKAKDESTATIKKVRSGFGGLMDAAKSAPLVFGAAAAGVAGLAAAGFSFVKAAAEEQASIKRLNQAIENLGGNTADMVRQSELAIRAAEGMAFADDEARSALSLLVAQTGDYTDAQHRLTVAQDLARGANLDLETAARLVGKITEENVQVLKRYGITLKDGATETEALAEIQKRFGGQAEEFASTGEGAWKKFNIQMENMKESIGIGLLPVFTKMSNALSAFLIEHQDDIERLSLLIGEKLGKAIEGVFNFLERHKETIRFVWETFRVGVQTVFEVLAPMFKFILDHKPLLIAAIAAIGVAIVVALGPGAAALIALAGIVFVIGLIRSNFEGLKGVFQGVVNSILGSLEGMVNGFLEGLRKIDQALPEAVSSWDVPNNITLPRYGGPTVPVNPNALGSFTNRPQGGAGGIGGVTIVVNADMTERTIQRVAQAVEGAANTGLRRTALQGTFQGGGLFA